MTLYVNTDRLHRVWPGLTGPDGHTVALAPGETVALDIAVDDRWLRPVSDNAAVKPGAGSTHTASTPKPEPTPQPPAEPPGEPNPVQVPESPAPKEKR